MRYYRTNLELAQAGVRLLVPWPVRAALAVLGVLAVLWLALVALALGGALVAFLVFAITA